MNSEHQEWLQKMEEQSRSRQKQFMQHIADRLGRPRVTEPPRHPFRGSPAFWQEFEWSEEERIAEFTANFLSVGGQVERLADWSEVGGYIQGLAEQMNAHYIVRQHQDTLAALKLEERMPHSQISVWNTEEDTAWMSRAAEADFGIVVADHAVAYTGSVTVLSSADKGRSVSLLPTALIVIIPVERLVTRLGEVLTTFDEAGREQLPAGIHFISGPSRSSDIENDLTIGVHGPGIVHALLVG